MPKPSSKLLFEVNLSPNNIKLEVTNTSSRVANLELDKLIQETWVRQQTKATLAGKVLTDSICYRLNNFVFQKNILKLDIAPAPYKVHSAMKALYGKRNILSENRDNTLITDGLVSTADGYYVFIEASRMDEEGALHLIGGCCSQSRVILHHSQDLTLSLRQLIKDKLQLNDREIRAGNLIGAVSNELGCINLIYRVSVLLTAAELQKRSTKNVWIKNVVCIASSDAKRFLSGSKGYIREVAKLL